MKYFKQVSKRSFAMLLVLVMSLGLLQTTAFAIEPPDTGASNTAVSDADNNEGSSNYLPFVPPTGSGNSAEFSDTDVSVNSVEPTAVPARVQSFLNAVNALPNSIVTAEDYDAVEAAMEEIVPLWQALEIEDYDYPSVDEAQMKLICLQEQLGLGRPDPLDLVNVQLGDVSVQQTTGGISYDTYIYVYNKSMNGYHGQFNISGTATADKTHLTHVVLPEINFTGYVGNTYHYETYIPRTYTYRIDSIDDPDNIIEQVYGSVGQGYVKSWNRNAEAFQTNIDTNGKNSGTATVTIVLGYSYYYLDNQRGARKLVYTVTQTGSDQDQDTTYKVIREYYIDGELIGTSSSVNQAGKVDDKIVGATLAASNPDWSKRTVDKKQHTFKYVSCNPDPLVLTETAADNVITLRYEKNTYTVTYTDGLGGKVFGDESHGNLSEGDATPACTSNTERKGYTFMGWSPAVKDTVDPAMADDYEIIYTATWEKDTPETATYTVQWLDATNNGAELRSETRTGNVGDTVAVKETDKSYTGYTYAGDNHEGTVLSATLAKSGTVLKMFFTEDPKAPDKPTPEVVNDLCKGNGRGAVEVYCQPNRHQVGYFNTIVDGRITIGDVTENNGTYTCVVTFNAQAYCNAYNTLKGTTADATKHTLVSGEEDETVTFTWNVTDEEWELAPNQTTPVEFYVECPAPGPETATYTVEWYDAATGELLTVKNPNPETRTGTIGNTVAVTDEDKVVEGYTFDEANENNVLSTVLAESGTVLKLYFTKNPDPTYTVTYTWTGLPAGTTNPAVPEEASYTVGAEVTMDTRAAGDLATVDGVTYQFSGWTVPDTVTVTDNKFAMPEENVTITGKWQVATTYKVEWYDAARKQIKTSETRYGIAGEMAAVTEDDKVVDGYVFAAKSTSNILQKEIAADGSTVLKLYFNAESLTVTKTAFKRVEKDGCYVDYTVTLKNNLAKPQYFIQLRDVMDRGLSFVTNEDDENGSLANLTYTLRKTDGTTYSADFGSWRAFQEDNAENTVAYICFQLDAKNGYFENGDALVVKYTAKADTPVTDVTQYHNHVYATTWNAN